MEYPELTDPLNKHFKRIKFKLRYYRHIHRWRLIKTIDKKEIIIAIFVSYDKAVIHISIMKMTLIEKEYDNQLPLSPLEKFIAQKFRDSFTPTDKFIRENFLTGDGAKNRPKPHNMDDALDEISMSDKSIELLMPKIRPNKCPEFKIDPKYPYNS